MNDQPQFSHLEDATLFPSAPRPAEPEPSSEERRWHPEDPDVVIGDQPAVAVYVNSFGAVIVRQERRWDEEEDACIGVRPEVLHLLIAALTRYLP